MTRVNNFCQGLSLFLLNLGPKAPSYVNERKHKKWFFVAPFPDQEETIIYGPTNADWGPLWHSG